MSTTCTHQTVLEYVGGGSDKLYVIQLQETVSAAGAEYATICYYGRRGATLSATQKYKGASRASARSFFDKAEREKTRKGYTHITVSAGASISGMPSSAPVFGGAAKPSSASATAAPTPPAAVGPLPMLASVIATEAELEALLVDANASFQRKYDGERAMVSMRRSGVVCTNRKGIQRPMSAKAEVELKTLLALPDFGDERETVLDGELMGDVFVAYDILTLRDNDMRGLPFDERYAALELLLEGNTGLLAPTAWSEAEKRALYRQALDEGWEGLIGRINSALYLPGRGKALWKFKLWATCTCRVLTVNTKRSVQLALRDEADSEVFVGNVTVPVNQEVPEPDSLVEVRYLYAMDGGSLYQPTLLSPRTDIDECDTRASLRPAPPEKRNDEVATVSLAEAAI